MEKIKDPDTWLYYDCTGNLQVDLHISETNQVRPQWKGKVCKISHLNIWIYECIHINIPKELLLH